MRRDTFLILNLQSFFHLSSSLFPLFFFAFETPKKILHPIVQLFLVFFISFIFVLFFLQSSSCQENLGKSPFIYPSQWWTQFHVPDSLTVGRYVGCPALLPFFCILHKYIYLFVYLRAKKKLHHSLIHSLLTQICYHGESYVSCYFSLLLAHAWSHQFSTSKKSFIFTFHIFGFGLQLVCVQVLIWWICVVGLWCLGLDLLVF